MEEHNVTVAKALTDVTGMGTQQKTRSRRSAYPGRNGNSIDGGAKQTLTSWHPVQNVPVDSIYIMIVRMQMVKNSAAASGASNNYKVHAEVQWRGPYGFLSGMAYKPIHVISLYMRRLAIDYPLLNFYAFMTIFYMILAVTWLFACLARWRELLRIQFWIGGVILVGLIEKTVFYAE